MNLNQARARYTAVVRAMYKVESGARGYGYVPTPMAPETYSEMVRAAGLSKQLKIPYPVYDGGCENTVFTNPDVNLMFRYLHDHEHINEVKDTSLPDEIALADAWAKRLQDTLGSDEDSKAIIKLAWLDTAGQSFYYVQYGEFPKNQLEFVRKCWSV